MALSTSAKHSILNAVVGKVQGLFSSCYIGLSSTEPNNEGGNITEPTTGGYKRTLVGTYNQSATQKFGTPTNGKITNDEAIYFEESTGSWGSELTHFVLYSSQTGGTMIGYGLLEQDGVAAPITVAEANTVVMIPVSGITISIGDAE